MKLSVLAAACAATLMLAGQAAAATVTYTLQGTWGGYSADLDSNGNAYNVVALNPTYVVLKAYGQTPETSQGNADFVQLTDATILVSGSPALSGDLGASTSSAFAVGTGPFSGAAAFGDFDTSYLVGAFNPGILFSGAGLNGFTGVTNLGPIPVTFLALPSPPSFLPPGTPDFTVSVGSKGMLFASFGEDTTFSAAIPEPATWGLMILGVLGAGAALRARRRQAALA